MCTARRKTLISFDAIERRLKLINLETGDGWRLVMEVLGLQGTSWTKGLWTLASPQMSPSPMQPPALEGSSGLCGGRSHPASVPEAGFYSRLTIISKYLN